MADMTGKKAASTFYSTADVALRNGHFRLGPEADITDLTAYLSGKKTRDCAIRGEHR